MTQFENITPTEQVLLLGFLPILGAGGQAGTALAAAVIGSVATVAVAGTARIVPEHYGQNSRWVLLLAIGLGLSYLLTIPAAFVVAIPDKARIYLYLIGATPLVYAGASRVITDKNLAHLVMRYIIIIVGFGFVREILGSGSLFGAAVFPNGFIPVGILAGSAGALFLWAFLALFSHLFAHRQRGKHTPHEEGIKAVPDREEIT